MIDYDLFHLFYTHRSVASDTPVKSLYAVDPSLYDGPTASITHITVGSDWRRAAVGSDSVETTWVGARLKELGAV